MSNYLPFKMWLRLDSHFPFLALSLSLFRHLNNIIVSFSPYKPLILQSVSRIQVNESSSLFSSWIWPLLNWAVFFEAAGQALKISSGLKSNHHWEI